MPRRKEVTAMQQLRRLKDDKRGSTLIEVIVSVLIVGIVFVPLMVGLNAALRVNKKTENELYAENVASNVIEVCKTYGTKGLANLKAEEDANPANPAKGISKIFSEAKLEKNSSTEYTITDIKCGTDNRLYSAKVVFEPIVNNQNDFSGYPTVEGIQDAIVINFAEDNFEWVMDEFLVYAEATGINPSNVSNAMNEEEMKKASNVQQWLSREIFIGIEQGTGEDSDKYIVTKKVVYTGTNIAIGGKYPFRDSAPATYQVTTQEKTVADPVGKYKDFPGMIIITYKQFKDSKGNNLNLNNGHGDTINISKLVAEETKVYALSENGKTLKDKGFLVSFDASSSVDDLTHAYTNLRSSMIYTNCIAETTFGTADSDQLSKMKNVTITVWDNYGEVVSEKKSTVIDGE